MCSEFRQLWEQSDWEEEHAWALTRASITSPAAVAVGVAVAILFGVFALSQLPIQLFPDIERPQLGIETDWRAETPREVESQIVQPEEDVLQGLPGVQEMDGYANNGGGYINLTFALGTDMQSTLVDVVGRLNRLPLLLADAQKPILQLANTQDLNATLIYIFMQKMPGNSRNVSDYQQFLKDVVVPRIEAVPGVGSVQINANGGTDELDIVFDPMRAAQLGIQIPKMAQQISGAEDVSGGNIDVGRRQYGLEFRGRYSVSDLKNLVLEWRDGKPVYLGDIADVHIGRSKAQGWAFQDGNPALGMNVFRASGANVLATVNAVKAEIAKLNDAAQRRNRASPSQYSFDPSHFIDQAVGMVTSDLVIGILLAVGVLWFFMREWRGTLIISTAIPICLCATVMLLNLAGRSAQRDLAGGSRFCHRHGARRRHCLFREYSAPARARHDGGRSLADRHRSGVGRTPRLHRHQRRDLLADHLPEGRRGSALRRPRAHHRLRRVRVADRGDHGRPPVKASMLFLKTRPKISELSNVWRRITDFVMKLTDTPRQRMFWITALILGSAAGTWLMMPPLHYLPQVKRAAIDGFVQFQSGETTVDFAQKNYGQVIMDRLNPYWTGEKQPKLLNYFVKMDVARLHQPRRARAQRQRLPGDREDRARRRAEGPARRAILRTDGQPVRRLRRGRRHHHQHPVQ